MNSPTVQEKDDAMLTSQQFLHTQQSPEPNQEAISISVLCLIC